MCQKQVAVIFALLSAKGGVFSSKPAASPTASPNPRPSAHGSSIVPASGSLPADGGTHSGEASPGDYWLSRYASLHHDVQDIQVRMGAIVQEMGDTLAALRAKGVGA